MTRDREIEMLDIVGGPADGQTLRAGSCRTVSVEGGRYTWALDDDGSVFWAFVGCSDVTELQAA